ncbi:hypothetical protein CPB86DRAFT_695092 [Serendipita vermifera]|nr:hypothetical protein CPB86DRAFT_695092 [Serendipita vermifera]
MKLWRTSPRVCTFSSYSLSLPTGHFQTSKMSSTASPMKEIDPPIDEITTGPIFWEKRREAWLQSSSAADKKAATNGGQEPPSKARARLESLLAPPLAEEDDAVWNDVVSSIWKGLQRGDKLKKNLPLPLVIKILRGGWIRDGTWPPGTHAPPDDAQMEVPEPPTRGQQLAAADKLTR